MTIPRNLASVPQKLSEYVRSHITAWRNPLSLEEIEFAPLFRGNEKLYTALTRLIESRIVGRAKLPVPSDPLICKAILERDNELRWLLSRLELVYHSSVSHPAQDSEQPTH